jgi:hypothetical protein
MQVAPHKGGAVVYRERTASSIPSKFETVLHMGPREKNGFWGRTLRFTEADNENPGPGAYTTQKQTAETASDSFSKKGYGNGFVSKTKRGPPGLRRGVPGPGQYDQTAAKETCFNRAKSTSAFAKPVLDGHSKHIPHTLPGPGAYNRSSMFRNEQRVGVAKPFATSGPRLAPGSKHAANVPPPGAYNVPGIKEHLDHETTPSYAFTSASSRPWEKREKSNRDQALEGIHHPAIKKSESVKPEMPGPGTYEPKLELEVFRGPNQSSVFDSKLDRFGKPIYPTRKKKQEPPPGPGHYDPSVKNFPPDEKVLVSSSYFMSNVSRMQAIDPEGMPPGPAYYNADAVPKKSFHLNAVQRWL